MRLLICLAALCIMFINSCASETINLADREVSATLDVSTDFYSLASSHNFIPGPWLDTDPPTLTFGDVYSGSDFETDIAGIWDDIRAIYPDELQGQILPPVDIDDLTVALASINY